MPLIVIVNDFAYINGGTAQIAIGDAIALARGGYQVVFFCAVGPHTYELDAAGVKVFCLGQQELGADPNRVRAGLNGLWNGKAAREFDALLTRLEPKPIVHLHGWSKALSSSIVPVALKHGAKLVLSLHDYFAACPNGGFYQFPQGRICELPALSSACIACNCDARNYGQKLYRVARQFIQKKVGLPDGIGDFIVHSRLARDVLFPYLPAAARLHAVPPAIDIEQAPPVAVSENGNFLMVGRLSPEKGPLLFAEAAKLADLLPVFVGEGRMHDAILEESPEAEITGWLDRLGVLRQLRKARAMVFPSLLYETFGLTVAEALALGVPPVVADRSAAAELIEDGKTGLLFRTGDAVHLASQLMLLKDPAFATALGAEAHARYWSHAMDGKRHLSALLKVYDTIGRY